LFGHQSRCRLSYVCYGFEEIALQIYNLGWGLWTGVPGCRPREEETGCILREEGTGCRPMEEETGCRPREEETGCRSRE
jgi:hypothetical protein